MRRYSFNHKVEHKTRCPKCNQRGRYTRYYDNLLHKYLPEQFGKCDRENGCGYHLSPWDDRKWLYDYEHNDTSIEDRIAWKRMKKQRETPPQPSFLPSHFLNSVMRGDNSLTTYLKEHFRDDIVDEAVELYQIGTTKELQPIFFQIDQDGNIRGGKIIYYLNNGHRNKAINPKWLHKLLNMENYILMQVPFGYHIPEDKPTAVVESEKSAIIMSIAMPQYRWIATGGSNNIRPSYLPLEEETTLFPDDDAAGDKWKEIAEDNGYGIELSWTDDIPEECRHTGWDVADYILYKYGIIKV